MSSLPVYILRKNRESKMIVIFTATENKSLFYYCSLININYEKYLQDPAPSVR